VFRRRRKVIIVNGCFWHLHGCPRCRMPASRRAYWLGKLGRNAARDKRVRRKLRAAGWRVLVVWECQVLRDHQRVQLRVEPVEAKDMRAWLDKVRARREFIAAQRGNLLDSTPIIAADRMRDEGYGR
jgi:DNA mismatch endonuclease, patch repair protein